MSSFRHLFASIPQGPAEGEHTHQMEQLQECLWPLKEGLDNLILLCSPALAMHLASSLFSSLMHSFCCLHGSTLCTTAHFPNSLALPPSGSQHHRTLKGSTWRGVQGPTQPSSILILRSAFDALSSAWQPHYGAHTPTGTDPIHVSVWCSNLDVLCVTHSKTVYCWRVSYPV